MKINNDKGVQINESIPVQHDKTERVTDQKEKEITDSLSISPEAAKIESAVKLVVAGMGSMRAEKVQQLQKDISDGTYKVDNKKLADVMLRKE